MSDRCQGRTLTGKQCKKNSRPGENYCKTHLYQKYEKTSARSFRFIGVLVTNPIFLLFIALSTITFGMYQCLFSPSKSDIPHLAGEGIQVKMEEFGLSPPKTYDEIREAIGKSCPEVGQAVCDKIAAASDALANEQYTEAEKLYDALVEFFPDVPDLHFNLGNACYGQFKLDKAAEEFSRVLNLDSLDAPAYNNLGLILTYQGKYSEADPLYKRALAIDEETQGMDHPNYTTYLNNLAELYDAQGRYSWAEPLSKRALEICENKLGPFHPHVATTLENISALYRRMGRDDEARKYAKQAEKIRAKIQAGE